MMNLHFTTPASDWKPRRVETSEGRGNIDRVIRVSYKRYREDWMACQYFTVPRPNLNSHYLAFPIALLVKILWQCNKMHPSIIPCRQRENVIITKQQ
jgi:hypothetical protein